MKSKEHNFTKASVRLALGLTTLLAMGLSQAGGLSEEATLGSDPLAALAPAGSLMNEAGDRVENRMTVDGRSRVYLMDRHGGETDLGGLGGQASVATGVEPNGQVLGVSLTPNGQPRPFLWQPYRGMFNLGLTGGSRTVASEPRPAAHGGVAGQVASARPMASSCPYAGVYKGRATGPWSIKIDAACQIRGSAINDQGYSLSLRGSVDEEGAYDLSGSTGARISGNIAPNGYVTGTWYSSGDSGSVSGRYVSAPKLSRLNPKQARAGDLVTVTGKNFWFVPGQVTFGKTKAEIVSWESAVISVVAPDLGVGGQGKKVKLKVRSLNGKASNVKTFRLLP